MSSPMLDVLAARVRDDPDRVAFHFREEPYSIGDLWASAGRVGAGLLDRGLDPGEPVVMALPNGPEFFHAFYGVQRAGGVAVPLFPDSSSERLLDVARLCKARWLIAPTSNSTDLLPSDPLVTSVAELSSAPREMTFPEVRPEDLAYVQYTSGSTGNPKGVQLSHANLAANVEQLIAGMEITSEEVFVSWLPAFHDMGLVLMTMVPFRLGASLHLLPSSLGDVASWLQTIERYRGTFTAAPDFAYRLLLRRVGDPPGYDLSSLRVALNAAEPVRLATIELFERRFGLTHVMMPGYGLAEATVGVSMWKPSTEVRTDEEGRVSVGHPFPEVEIAIHDEGSECEPGEVGEILVRSPGNTRGYLDNPEASRRLFCCNGYIRTGDLGYLDGDGYLYIVGRRKNVIIRAGRSIAPLEVEESVDAWPFVRFSAAVGIDRGGPEGEQVYVFAELRPPPPDDPAELQARAVDLSRSVHGRLGIRPARVYLLKPHSIPLTDTGKIRYPLLKERYLSGKLRENRRIVYPDF